jgi:hypothetical protein
VAKPLSDFATIDRLQRQELQPIWIALALSGCRHDPKGQSCANGDLIVGRTDDIHDLQLVPRILVSTGQ